MSRLKSTRLFNPTNLATRQMRRMAILWGLGLLLLLLSPAAFAQSCTGTGIGGCQQVTCANGGMTAISGTVYAPNGTDPLPNILVYIPTTSLTAFLDGVSTTNPIIDDAVTLVSGTPLVQTTTAANGTFTLKNVPPGSDIPLVIQAGRWRREFIISTVPSCQTTPITTVTQGGPITLASYGESTLIRFAQNQGEGDIPKMALATGKADALECTLRKVGIADTEFTDYTVNVSSGGSAPGRVNLFEGSGDSGVKPGSTAHTEATLVGSTSSLFSGSLLGNYNILMLPCQGDSNNYTTADGRNNVIAYTGAGGRIFATHHSAFYINENSPIDTSVNWTADTSLSDGTATINTNFSSGNTLAQWLQDLGATTTLGQVSLTNVFNDQSGVNLPTESWATLNSDSDVMQLTFYTPVGATAANQFGRVMFNEYHVDNTTTSSSVTFPNECTGTMAKAQSMTAQEHMLEYSLFDLMNFAVPVVSTNVSIAVTPSPATFTGGDLSDSIDVSVTNNGSTAIATNPTVTLGVTLPAGLTAVTMTDPAGNWSCNVNTLTCTLLNPLGAGSNNSISIGVSVAANVTAGSASIGATVGSTGFVASTTGNVSLNVNIAPPGTITGPTNLNATSTNVGSTTTSAASGSFALSAGTTISSILVVTEGFTGKDFTNAGSGTCAAQTYASATTCTVNVNFSPLYPGQRNGAIEIFGPSNTLLDIAYISGIGIGPEAIFLPGTQGSQASGSGSNSFDDVTVDLLRNIYIADFANNQILKETYSSGSYTQSAAFSGLNGPTSVAIDGAGDLYIADATGNQVLKETLTNGSYTQSVIGSGLSSPSGVAVDGDGNVYISDSGNNRVLLEARSGSNYIQSVIDSELSSPSRIAVDSNGDVYIADTGNNRVVEDTLLSGVYTQSTIASGLSSPSGVSVDSNGNIYICDTGNNRVLQEGLVNGSYSQSILATGLNAPRGVTLDELGNLYIADYGDNQLYREDYSDAPSLSFASTTANTVSSDSPKTVTLMNFGTSALTAVTPGIAAPTDFPQVTGNASDCTTTFSLSASVSCALRIEFDPGTTGAKSESFVLTDNNLNSSSTTQTIAVSGTATAAVSITILPSALVAPEIGSSYSLSFAASGGTSPYTYSVISGSLPTGLTLASGGLLSGTPTAVGTFSFTVQAQDSTSGTPYTGSVSYTVTIAAPTIALTPSTLPGGTVATSYSQTISASGGSNTYSYAVTSGSLPAGLSLNSSTGALTGTPTSATSSTFTITATDTVTTGPAAPYTGSQSYTLVIGKGTATISISNLPASGTYGGSFTPTFSYAGDGTASVSSNSTSICTVTSGVVHYVGAGTCSLTASATAGTNYAAVTGTAQTFSIGQATPTISISNLPASGAYGSSFTPTFSYTGDGTASVSSNSTSICTVTSGVVHYVGVGTCSLTASATAGSNYTSVTGTAQTFSVGQATPTISISNLPASGTYGGSFTPTFSYTGDGTASVSSNSTSICTVTSGVVHYVGVGTCSLTASATAGTNYAAVTGTAQTFSVGQATPTINISNLPASGTYGGSFTPTFSYTGDGTASVSSNSTSICTVTSGVVHYVGAGTCSLTASATAGTNYAAVTGTAQTFSVGKATPTVTWSTPTAITYGTALSATQLNASSATAGTFVYTPASGTVLNAGANQTLSVTFTPTDTTDYNNATQTVQITVNKATPTVSWSTPAAITYGTALSATQLNASSATAGTFVYTPASGTVLNAGANQTLSVTFTPTDTTDYNNATQTVQITVNKATPTVSWSTPAAITYGTALSATQLNASSATAGTFVYTPASGTVLNAGANQTLSVTFTPTDTTDYNNATQTVQITVNKATPTVIWPSPSAITYGTALSATQLNATSATAGTFVYTPASGTVLNAGANQTLSVTFTPTDTTDYNNATQTVQITVNKATPTVSWSTPAAITYGTALSATQLNATSATAGTFVYTPASGTVLNAGANQTLSVTFTPTDTTDYNNATQTVQITVNKATPTVIWPSPSAITYGTTLSATQLNASSATAGAFVYTPAAGTMLNAGANQTLSVTFTPTDTTDYANATQTVEITVNKATPTVSWSTSTAITYGTALSATQLNASSATAGTFVYTPASGTVLNAGANQTLSVIFTPTDTTDYTSATQTVLITVSPAMGAVTTLATNSNPALFGNPVTFTATVSAVVGMPNGNVSFMDGTTLLGTSALSNGVATFSTSSLATGSHPITAVYSGDADFGATTSAITTQMVLDFTLNATSGSSTSQTAPPGGSATYTFAITPTNGTSFPTVTYLTVTGLPDGATATLATPGWSQMTNTSWSLPAFAQLSNVSLSFQVPAATARLDERTPFSGRLPLTLAALLFLPFSRRFRRSSKQLGRIVPMLLLAATLVTVTGLSGCGSNTGNGFFGQARKSYIVTVTVTTGNLSQSTNVTLATE